MAFPATPVALLSTFLASFPDVLERVPVMAWMTDVDGRATFTNRQWLTFIGRTFEQERDLGWTEIVHPDDRQRCVTEYRRAHEARAPFSGKYRWRGRDGTFHLIETSGVPLYDPTGEFQGYVGLCADVTRDLTRQQELERERNEHATLLTNLIANMSDAVLVESDEGRVLLTNDAFCRLYDPSVEPSALIGADAAMLTEQLSACRTRLAKLKMKGRPSVGEEIVLPDGRVLDLHYAPVHCAPDTIAHLWQFRDISARKQFEAELHASRQRLRELATHAEAVREEERRGAARLLHDELGQILTSVKLELAAATDVFRAHPDEQVFNAVDRLQSAAGLVDVSIQTVQRVSAKLRPEPVPELRISEALRFEAHLFEQRTKIRCRITVSPPKLELDAARSAVLYRILLEALTNVTRHAAAGAVHISLKQKAGVVFLSVRDNGRGIAQEEIDNPVTMGLLGMRERALSVGGDVRITRGGRSGTTVTAIIPLHPEPSAPSDAGAGRPQI